MRPGYKIAALMVSTIGILSPAATDVHQIFKILTLVSLTWVLPIVAPARVMAQTQSGTPSVEELEKQLHLTSQGHVASVITPQRSQ